MYCVGNVRPLKRLRCSDTLSVPVCAWCRGAVQCAALHVSLGCFVGGGSEAPVHLGQLGARILFGFLLAARTTTRRVRQGPRGTISVAVLDREVCDAGGAGAAGRHAIEVGELDLAEVVGAKSHGEVTQHLLVAKVLHGERLLAGVHGSSLLLLLLFLVAARAKGEGS